MRLPRFTTRRLMVLVAVVGMALGMNQRARRLNDLYDHHISMLLFYSHIWQTGPARYHELMAEKCEYAARYPWLPVPPGPPPPK